eukprot:TRINITY_DN12867_c0_g1_i1.p1 TRINITY_DN12867_c0_g1~~TRINITY_DN12867_c0_g1_i1.p1  ORF type:complete len:179 (+),score=3.23 TRINITY_DN12867_c0_g1_i1:42-578(+)
MSYFRLSRELFNVATRRRFAFFQVATRYSPTHPRAERLDNYFHGVLPWISCSRSFSTGAVVDDAGFPVVSKAELRSRIDKKLNDYILIDVRRGDELEKTGQIETAVNIPVEYLDRVLALEPDEFEEVVGFAKSELAAKQLVFSCWAGTRSMYACQIAQKHGYKNVLNYQGSARDWFNL